MRSLSRGGAAVPVQQAAVQQAVSPADVGRVRVEHVGYVMYSDGCKAGRPLEGRLFACAHRVFYNYNDHRVPHLPNLSCLKASAD